MSRVNKYKIHYLIKKGGEDVKLSSNARDILFTQMDSLAIQMDVLSSLSDIGRKTANNIDSIIKSIKKGRCVNRKIENLIGESKKDNKKERVT